MDILRRTLHKFFPRYKYIVVQRSGLFVTRKFTLFCKLAGLTACNEALQDYEYQDAEYIALLLEPSERRNINSTLLIMYNNDQSFFDRPEDLSLIKIPSWVNDWVVCEDEDGSQYISRESNITWS